jgi:hypothetical protein
MAYRRVRDFYETRFGRVAFVIEIAVVALWLISAIIPPLRQALTINNLLLVIVMFFVLDTLKYVVDLKLTNANLPPSVRVFGSHADADEYVRMTLLKGRKTEHADFILFAGNSADPTLRQLRDSGTYIRILLHGESDPLHHGAAGGHADQSKRISVGLGSLELDLFRDYTNVEVYTYSRPPSIRGMLIDNWIVAVNWYTYVNTPLGLEGQGNPMLVADRASPEGSMLADMFERAFDNLLALDGTELVFPLTRRATKE